MKQQMDPCKEEYTQWKLKNTESNLSLIKITKRFYRHSMKSLRIPKSRLVKCGSNDQNEP